VAGKLPVVSGHNGSTAGVESPPATADHSSDLDILAHVRHFDVSPGRGRPLHSLGGKRKLRHDHSILRRVCMRLDPLLMLVRANRDVQLPLPGLPALQWRKAAA
jgi:hypothetical protein